MTNHDSRAFAAKAMPALVVALLLGCTARASASEGQQALPATPTAPAAQAAAVARADSAAHPALIAASRHMVAAATPVAAMAAAPAAATPASAAPAPATGATLLPLATPPAAAPQAWSDTSGTWRQAGAASWYGGRRWQGKKTAAGTRYDENQLTAAHASLPIGSQVRVTVADTGRSVVVTINDRPGTRKRVIDLSRAAAAELGIIQRGVAHVHLTASN